MVKDDTEVLAYADFFPVHARDPVQRPLFEKGLAEQLVSEVPEMVTRLAKLEPLITLEVDVDFTWEAVRAFYYGLWRAVIGLVGMVAESFTNNLYDKILSIRLNGGVEIPKADLLGNRPSERSKLAMLRLNRAINANHYAKLVKIKRLRNLYVHPTKKARNAEKDALVAIRLLRSILKDRFEENYIIKDGKIYKRK